MNNTPHHIAIIMDGNRRWAKRNGREALFGHEQGAKTLKSVARAVHEKGCRWLTVFAFSFENWTRPKAEVDGLMLLLRRFLENDINELNGENVKLRVIGSRPAAAGVRVRPVKVADLSFPAWRHNRRTGVFYVSA